MDSEVERAVLGGQRERQKQPTDTKDRAGPQEGAGMRHKGMRVVHPATSVMGGSEAPMLSPGLEHEGPQHSRVHTPSSGPPTPTLGQPLVRGWVTHSLDPGGPPPTAVGTASAGWDHHSQSLGTSAPGVDPPIPSPYPPNPRPRPGEGRTSPASPTA